MADRCERIANRANAEITALEGREKALYAKLTRDAERKAALLREAEVSRRQAVMMRGKGK